MFGRGKGLLSAAEGLERIGRERIDREMAGSSGQLAASAELLFHAERIGEYTADQRRMMWLFFTNRGRVPSFYDSVPVAAIERPAAWRKDPTCRFDYRWWDGRRWTDSVSRDGIVLTDSMPATGHSAPSGY